MDEIEIKTCKYCGQTIARRQYPCGTWEGPRGYARRQYCSRPCAEKASHRPRPDRPHRVKSSLVTYEEGSRVVKVTKVALQFLERDVPITEWETSRWKR